jgi:flagellar P-ring protein precursor FlgI
MRAIVVLIAISLIASQAHAASTARIKDLVDVQGVRSNELYGYGLVVGLNGSGDTEQTGFTQQALAGMLGRFGNRLASKDIRVRNVAAVMVTARLQTFARPGTRIDVSVASMGDARSLAGGVLLITPLTGADGLVYAVSQGPVQVGGYDVAAAGSFARKNQPNSGRVPDGATVEREVSVDLSAQPIVLALRHPDATTASRIAAAVNAKLGEGTARALDPAAVEVKAYAASDAGSSSVAGSSTDAGTPTDAGTSSDAGALLDPVTLLAQIELLEVESDDHARVVVSERTGTVVAGEHVRLRPAMVAHGGLTVNIASTPFVSQPAPFSQGGRTVRADVAAIDAREAQGKAVGLASTTTVDELVRALNTLGATPRDLIAILQALQAAGALDAEIEVL